MLKIFSQKKRFALVFAVVLLLSFFLRFWQLGKLPPSLNSDEVALGYNAYSLLKTGRDEYGQRWPLVLRSYDDYKPPVYAYVTAATMAVFGKNEFSIRFPSALAGFLTTILVFFIVRKLTGHKWLALTSFFLLSLTPWHIQYSRLAFEVNLSIFWLVLGIWLILKGRTRGVLLLLAAISFGFSLYTYHAARLLAPLLVLAFFLFFWQDFLDKKKWLVISFLVGLLFVIPLIKILQGTEGQLRPFVVSIFADTNPKEIFRERIQRDLILGIPFGNLWHNRRLIYLTPFLKSYLAQFRPEFLFTGDPHHSAPDIGLLYLWQLPFIFLGIHYLILKEKPKIFALLILWFLISPLAAGLTQEAPSSHRALPVVVPLTIIMAYGLFFFLERLKKSTFFLAKSLFHLIFLAIFIFFVYYLHMYYVHSLYEISPLWGFGRVEAAREAKRLENNYQRIMVSVQIPQAYMYFLFYTDYDPQTYLNEGGTVSGGFIEMKNHFGKYEFHLFDTDIPHQEYENALLIGDAGERHNFDSLLKTIKYPDGRDVIKIGTVNVHSLRFRQ